MPQRAASVFGREREIELIGAFVGDAPDTASALLITGDAPLTVYPRRMPGASILAD